MNFYKIIWFSILFFPFVNVKGQDDSIVFKNFDEVPQSLLQKDEDGNIYYYDARQRARIYQINGERVVILDELEMYVHPKFNNNLDKKYYYFLNKKLSKVYPIFLKTLQRYRSVESNVTSMERKREKRKYVKKIQEEFAEEYRNIIHDLTPTEGQMLAKLMCRATGKTVYEMIKDLRGGWSAFWWEVKGKSFNVDISSPYDPHKYRDDEYVESLLQSAWNNNTLPRYGGCETFYQRK